VVVAGRTIPVVASVTILVFIAWLAANAYVFSLDASDAEWMLFAPSLPTPVFALAGAALTAWWARRAGRRAMALRDALRCASVFAPVAVLHAWGVRMSGFGPSVFGVQSFFDRIATGRLTALWLLLLCSSLAFPLLATVRGLLVGLARSRTLLLQAAITLVYLPLMANDAMLLVYSVQAGELAAVYGPLLRVSVACTTTALAVLDYRAADASALAERVGATQRP